MVVMGPAQVFHPGLGARCPAGTAGPVPCMMGACREMGDEEEEGFWGAEIHVLQWPN